MATTFTRAPELAVGDPITSTQWSKLADAFNDRLRSGLGDGPWRVHFWWLNLFRQVRNSDTSGGLPAASAYPPQGEFFDIYQHVNPRNAVWPVAGPGEPEGANVANPMMAYVFGNEASGLPNEEDRYIALEWPGGDPESVRPALLWLYAKQQRGAVDPDTGALGCPAFDVAQAHAALRQNDRSPYGKSYGGYLPLPEEVMGGCDDPDDTDDVPAGPGYKYRFTQIVDMPNGGVEEDGTYYVRSGSVTYDAVEYSAGETFTGVAGTPSWTGDGTVREMRQYEGSCVPTDDFTYDDHVAYIAYYPWAYYVYLNDGTVDTLLTNVWVEGPYQGRAELRKADGDHLQRVLWGFMREFRGSVNQVADQTQHLQHAFDFHRFFTTQYLMAPNIGTETGGLVQETYPLFELKNKGAGTRLTYIQSSGDRHFFRQGFVFAGALAYGTNVAQPFEVEVLDGDTLIDTFTCTPDESGTVERLYMPTPFAPTALGFRIKNKVTFTGLGSGTFAIEANELFPYKPQIQDAAMLIRASANIPNEPDGVGTVETDADVLSDDYFQFGCIVNRANQLGLQSRIADVNPNAVFDAARRFSRHARAPRRQDLLGYAVEGGKSVLWFRRHTFGLSGDVDADAWDGIAPPADYLVSGDILEGETYEVREGSVNYNGATYTEGQRFTGVSGVFEFGGGGRVYVADGIKHVAIPQGETNEWLLGVNFAHSNPSESSIWKPGAYTDWINHLTERCLFYAPDLAANSKALWHMAFGQKASFLGNLYAEAPTGYRYAEVEFVYDTSPNLNENTLMGDTDRENFYRSCRIYEPDVEVESCEVVIEGGEERVKVTLTGRLHHCEGVAPASIDRDVSTWNSTDLRAEPYRTAENGIREYLYWASYGTLCQHEQAGNAAINSAIYSQTDAPNGACFPKIRLTKLIPKPYDDGNDTQQVKDTKFLHDSFAQMELYLRCMCEGYVDGVTSAEIACRALTGYVYDYSFQALVLEATGNRWLPAFTVEDRPDNPQGFGPMPNTVARAEVFNALSRCVNLLTTVRVMLPASVECMDGLTDQYEYSGAYGPDGSSVTCVEDATAAIYIQHSPPLPGVDFSGGSWYPCNGVTVGTENTFTGSCSGDAWELRTRRTGARMRYVLTDPLAVHALPGDIAGMLEENGEFLAQVRYITTRNRRINTTVFDDATRCNPDAGPDPGPEFIVGGGVYLQFIVDTLRDETVCETITAQALGPAAPSTALWYSYAIDAPPRICGGGSATTMEVSVLNGSTSMIRVPLVD